MKQGRIIPNGVTLEKHEYRTVLFFTNLGYDVELIPRSNKQGEKRPDIRMTRLLWEMKSPKGEGESLMKNTVQKAVQQSENVIVDLRRVKRHQDKCLAELRREFENSKSIRKLKAITKDGKLVDFSK